MDPSSESSYSEGPLALDDDESMKEEDCSSNNDVKNVDIVESIENANVEPAGETRPNESFMLRFAPLLKNEARGWSTKDTFRALYVAWRERMREQSNFTFKPQLEYNETDDFIHVRARRDSPDDPRPRDFIQLNKEKGILSLNIVDGLILTPREAPAADGEPEPMLKMVTKILKPVGVMVFAGYGVRVESSRERVDFSFHGESLAFTNRPSTEEAFLASMNLTSNGASAPEAVGSRDVTITTGPGETANPPGGVFTRKVEREKFLNWLTVTLDIANLFQPTSVVSTEHGDLHLHTNSANKVYADGILLSTAIAGPFQYGYHFFFRSEEEHAGVVSEDFELIPNEKETQLRCRIWEAAIDKDEVVLPLFVRLLRCNPEVVDVTGVMGFLQTGTARKIWELLVSEIGREKVFCREMDNAAQVMQYTNRQIVAIPALLWSILRRHSIIRTWAEELLYKAAPIVPPLSSFSITIQHALKALLKLDPQTSNTQVIYVDHPLFHPSIYLNHKTSTLLVSKYWLDFSAVHKAYPCRLTSTRAPGTILTHFPCDHVIISLYEQTVDVVGRAMGGYAGIAWASGKRQMAVEKIEEMPRQVCVRQTMYPGELLVAWLNGVSPGVSWLVDAGYHVILHREGCSGAVGELHDATRAPMAASCGCPQQTLTQHQMTADFKNLDPNQKYIPKIALNTKNSIYSIPYAPVAPKPDLETCTSASALINPSGGVNRDQLRNFWETWQKVNFPVIFNLFTPVYGVVGPESGPGRLRAVHDNERLHHRFERHQYLVVQMRSSWQSGPQEMHHYVLYIHGVYPPCASDTAPTTITSGPPDTENEGWLVATMYSFLRTTSHCLFQVGLATDPRIGLRELLLHYSDFDAMGTRRDAVVLPVRDVMVLHVVDPVLLGGFESVDYTVDPPPDISRTGYYCRFAMRCNGYSDAACIMPVASHLLPHSKRWPEPRYALDPRPSVIDLTPGCLGLAEGFRQAGMSVDAALGFDPVVHQTWKARYPTTKIYDGPLHTILKDLTTKTLPPLPSPKNHPRIALLTIPDQGPNRTWEATITDFNILQTIPSLLTNTPFFDRPDFLIITFPPWIFIERAFNAFFNAMYTLLTHRYALHMKSVYLPRHGMAVENHVLVLVASCVPSPVPWEVIFDKIHTDEPGVDMNVSAGLRIGDLAFENPRSRAANMNANMNMSMGVGGEKTMVCRHPLTKAEVYNHTTGFQLFSQALGSSHPVAVNFSRTIGFEELRMGVRHFQRKDILTPRELARLQGFPDDFILLGVHMQQYADVLGGFPPPIAKKLAGCLGVLVREYCCGNGVSRGHGYGAEPGVNQRLIQGQGQVVSQSVNPVQGHIAAQRQRHTGIQGQEQGQVVNPVQDGNHMQRQITVQGQGQLQGQGQVQAVGQQLNPVHGNPAQGQIAVQDQGQVVSQGVNLVQGHIAAQRQRHTGIQGQGQFQGQGQGHRQEPGPGRGHVVNQQVDPVQSVNPVQEQITVQVRGPVAVQGRGQFQGQAQGQGGNTMMATMQPRGVKRNREE